MTEGIVAADDSRPGAGPNRADPPFAAAARTGRLFGMTDRTGEPVRDEHAFTRAPRAAGRWLSWLIGAALFGAVVIVVAQLSDAQVFLRMLAQVELSWLLVAAATQALTYLSESQVWRSVTSAAGTPVALSTAYQLSIAKLFVDQAVPTGGLSGTLVYVEGLRRAGVARSVALTGVVVDAFSYYCSYALCVAAALVIAATQGSLNGPIAAIAAVFAIFSTAFAVAVLFQAGRNTGPFRRLLERSRLLGRVLRLLREAEPKLAHDPRVLGRALGWQVTIQLLDAATIWFLLLALGSSADPRVVFASYMFSALFRTLSFSPGGLGTFEAASVAILRAAGVPLETAFAATLLFRGLNFWVPMIPGLWCARRVMRSKGPFSLARR